MCAAAGVAVLRELEEKDLFQKAADVGGYMKEELEKLILSEKSSNIEGEVNQVNNQNFGEVNQISGESKRRLLGIGAVRGCGLFLGIEFRLFRRGSRVYFGGAPFRRGEPLFYSEPATQHTSLLCIDLMRKRHILTSIDGPDDNVLVVKPPMVFTRENVDEFVRAIKITIKEINAILEEGEANGEPEKDGLTVGHTPT